ncbi:hypothetical protein H7J07_09680 [Mycobacterium koreense]|uniref:Uncharacterized protein n=1 Tax=Mycolicibacillus koreensis TaxID=1069220 RepID=A0A7I7SF78_9MYCO|nr:hypothetical protein [Mycolicibacillus koreensis]MCV7248482.1 hypothetical protein [Mycolicibacillus koreensis]OSC33084.1 hypothetical protein B8W67_12505 [Mycolicibacillus koreensis]BBY55438.1 hypothetical protein MKOR_26890 [Mycolicibacillus koreensis]
MDTTQASRDEAGGRHGFSTSLVAVGLALVIFGVAWVVAFRGDHDASLVGRPAWELAAALPSADDVPAEWDYSLSGKIGRVTPVPTPIAPLSVSAERYTPRECGDIPVLDQIPGDAAVYGGSARVELTLPGEHYQLGHKAHFYLYTVDEPRTVIADYIDWAQRCTRYHYSGTNAQSGSYEDYDATRTVDTALPDGAEAGVAVNGERFAYLVRGIMVQGYTNMEGGDRELIERLVAATVRKLAAL